MTTKLQLKLRGIFLTDDTPETLTNPIGNIFSMFFSAIGNFFMYLISLITNPIYHLFSTIISAISNFFSTIISTVCNFFQHLISFFPPEIIRYDEHIHHLIDDARPYLLPIVVVVLIMFLCYWRLLFTCFKAVCSIFKGILWCLLYGAKAGVKMMIAPSQPLLLISMAAVEAPISLAFGGA